MRNLIIYNVLLIIMIFIMVILTAIKIYNQEVLTEYKISDSNSSIEDLQYEVQRQVEFGEESKYSEFNENGERVNTSSEMAKEQVIEDGIVVKDFNLVYKDNNTSVVATVINSTSEEKGGYPVDLIICNDKDEEILTLGSYLNKIAPNSESKISTGITADIADAYKCKVVKKEVEN